MQIAMRYGRLNKLDSPRTIEPAQNTQNVGGHRRNVYFRSSVNHSELSRKGSKMKRMVFMIIVVLLFCLSLVDAAEDERSILKEIGVARGICVLLGDT